MYALSRDVLWFVALLSLLPGVLDAQEKVGIVCLTKSNQVVVRSKCRSGEAKLSLNELASRAPIGDTGAAGANGILGRTISYTNHGSVTVPAGGIEFTQECPVGKTTLSGGCYSNNAAVLVSKSFPFDSSPRAWKCEFIPVTGSGVATSFATVTYAICADE